MSEEKKSVPYELIEHFIKLSDTEHKRKDIVIIILVILLFINNFVWLGVRTYERKNLDEKIYDAIQVYHMNPND